MTEEDSISLEEFGKQFGDDFLVKAVVARGDDLVTRMLAQASEETRAHATETVLELRRLRARREAQQLDAASQKESSS